jgi:hypothetical protein
MEPIDATFELVKVDDNTWDVLIFAEKDILQAFQDIYPNLFYVEESVFKKLPVVIAPDFPNRDHASLWREYWKKAFADPDNSCDSCPTVKDLLGRIEKSRND